MVKFTNRKGPTPQEETEPWPIEVKPKGGQIQLPIRPEQVANAIACYIYDGDDVQPNLTHLKTIVEEAEATVSESLKVKIYNSKEDDSTDIGTINIRSKGRGSIAVINLHGHKIDDIFDERLITSSSMEREDMMNSIINFLVTTKEKVRLGYGPMHVFDDIDPINSTKSLTTIPIDKILPIYKNWLSQIHTKTEETTNEHGFLVDSRGNTIGILEGNNHSVPMPILDSNEGQFSAHTHPKIRSSLTPSKNDMIHFNKYLKVGGKGVILHAGGSIYYGSDYNDDRDGELPSRLYDNHLMLSLEKQKVKKYVDIKTVKERNKDNLEKIHDASYKAMIKGLNDQADNLTDGYYEIIEEAIKEHGENAERGEQSDTAHFEYIREQYRINNIVFTYNPIAIER